MKELINKITLGDSTEIIKRLPNLFLEGGVIITDPPYKQDNTTCGGNSDFSKSFQKMNKELSEYELNIDLGIDWCKEIPRLQKKINVFIWCNKAQSKQYMDYFIDELDCKHEMFFWRKPNAPPTFNGKALTDKEYCLHFRKGGYFNPANYEDAKTIWDSPINIKDKKLYQHPTIKPEWIIETIIRNSTKQNDLVFDPFSGSGTTAVCCHRLKRNFIAIEKSPTFYKSSCQRLSDAIKNIKVPKDDRQKRLFE